MTSNQIRSEVVQSLSLDLVGPDNDHVFFSFPSSGLGTSMNVGYVDSVIDDPKTSTL